VLAQIRCPFSDRLFDKLTLIQLDSWRVQWGGVMIRAMIKATTKVIKEMPWWQKVLIGSAAAVAFNAAAKGIEYFIQEIEEPANKKSDKMLL